MPAAEAAAPARAPAVGAATVRPAGVALAVEPVRGLLPAERRSLLRLGGQGFMVGAPPRDAFVLRLVGDRPWPEADPDRYPDGRPARIESTAGRLRVTHARFLAELEPERLCGRLYRRELDGAGLEAALRVALTARLPLAAGLPLHSTGVIVRGAGVAFFGPSGAGKTTLAAACPWPVLSDELVAVRGAPWRLAASGFWGSLERPVAPARRTAPLAALVELGRGRPAALERLAPGAALRRLLGVVTVPPAPLLWRAALEVLGRVVREVPVLRLTWSPGEPPWNLLEDRLGRLGATP